MAIRKDLMSDQDREQVQRLTGRLKELLGETGGSEFMTQAQWAELFSITQKLGPIYDKYDPRKR